MVEICQVEYGANVMKVKHFSAKEIQELDRLERLNLINSVTGFKSANLIGSIDAEGNTNLTIFSSVFHLGSNPALVGMMMRPVVGMRHTYENILATGFYTINHVGIEFIENAHYTSAKFPKEASEFDACKLTEQFVGDFKAPYVRESRLKIGLKLVDDILIEANQTRLIIGSIEHVYIEGDAIKSNGSVNLESIGSVCISGLDTYHRVNDGTSFPYAKKDELPELKSFAKRSDAVAFDQKTGTYNASLLPYATSASGPAFSATDLSVWKNVAASKMSAHFKTRFEEIKDEYDEMMSQFEWNQIVHNSKIGFEPIVGEEYYLYERDDGERFLSIIPPHTWKKKLIGSFKLTTDRMWLLLEQE
jgi:flavin reductase (DIM6/NTAB) family NADH-FMN oxidoreductase RutF